MSKTDSIISRCQAGRLPLFIVGSFEKGVTVYSQQTRALNLAYALIESGSVKTYKLRDETSRRTRIAIIGGGIAGLTFAAGLMRKHALADMVIFEQGDTLLPLQQGNDTRWLHPRIYNWPVDGSESTTATLPVMNWTAGRASDVAVQLLDEWRKTYNETGYRRVHLRLYCNARHIQIHQDSAKGLALEWVGQTRIPRDGGNFSAIGALEGSSERFDIVVLAMGFGLEKDSELSYWQNDTYGQRNLKEPRQTYLVSGQGDGALIDLLRVRISRYRQDRILYELFQHTRSLVRALKALYEKSEARSTDLFHEFEKLIKSRDLRLAGDTKSVLRSLRSRLRGDTDAILHLKVRRFEELFHSTASETSFQNKVLAYLLYKVGGFFVSSLPLDELTKKYSIKSRCVITRHGVETFLHIKEVVSKNLSSAIARFEVQRRARPQVATPQWPGGYFGFPGPEKDAVNIADILKKTWRKEYLPGPVALISTTFCSTLVGFLRPLHPANRRLRVTLHRTIRLGDEELLQQTCNYQGINLEDDVASIGRTFDAKAATIGLAYKTRKVVRTRKGMTPNRLQKAMTRLGLPKISSKMSDKVCFLLAIPILQPTNSFLGKSPVAGVIYIDSEAKNFFLTDDVIRQLLKMVSEMLEAIANRSIRFSRIQNLGLESSNRNAPNAIAIPQAVRGVFSSLNMAPPDTKRRFQFNFEHYDFLPVSR